MSDINLKNIIEQFPDCITNGAKLKAILLDTYPEISKGIINAILIISNSGIAKEIQNSVNIDKIATDRWLKKLENDYCMSGSTVEKCLQLWINAFTIKFMNPLLNASPTVSESKIYDWIARKEDDDEIDEEFRKIDLENFQTLFAGTADSISEISLAQEIENSLKDEKICKNLSDYIVNCSYIINKMKKNMGFAYFMLAKGLHICDSNISACDPEQYYEAQASGYDCSHFRWSGYVNEIDAICELTNFQTKNINILIEHLLILSWENDYQAAAIALLSTYTSTYIYKDSLQYYDWNEEGRLIIPWFDITCMDQNFNSFEVDWNYVNVEENKTKAYESYYARKAMEVLQKYRNLITGDYTPANASYISDIASYYEYLGRVLGVEFYEKYIKQELPFIKLYADKGNSEMIGLILDYYKNHDIANYWSNFIKYGKNGDYRTQCKIAEFYNNQFDDMHQESDFKEASKWYELAIDNKARDIDSLVIENYKKMLEQYDAKKYADKINNLQREINACHSEWDYRMRYV